MSQMYRRILRPLLFCIEPELAHASAIELCRAASHLSWLASLVSKRLHAHEAVLYSEVAGIAFQSPVGLAAGWDKSARAVHILDRLGFGFAEIGSVSSEPSAGNPKPRLFRLPMDQAIIVNYGLPNDGAKVARERLLNARLEIPLGVNLVQTNRGPSAAVCSEGEVLSDFENSFRLLNSVADYVVLNLSCPNARGGKEHFAEQDSITRLLERLQSIPSTCPVFLKVPPSLDPKMHQRWLREAETFPFMKGFLFNLPSGKPEGLRIRTPRKKWENLPGAVSGPPVAELMLECIRSFAKQIDRTRHVIIGSGGIASGADAYRMIRAGASLVQLYTALIYEGPSVASRINRELAQCLTRDGFASVQDAVGVDI